MSEQNQENETNALAEVTRKVVISPEDVAGAADFWTHFEIPMPPELRAAFDAFTKEPNLVNQDEIKLQITKAIGHTDHEAFKDEMFKEIVAECQNVNYDLSFDRELENTLGREGDSEEKLAVAIEKASEVSKKRLATAYAKATGTAADTADNK